MISTLLGIFVFHDLILSPEIKIEKQIIPVSIEIPPMEVNLIMSGVGVPLPTPGSSLDIDEEIHEKIREDVGSDSVIYKTFDVNQNNITGTATTYCNLKTHMMGVLMDLTSRPDTVLVNIEPDIPTVYKRKGASFITPFFLVEAGLDSNPELYISNIRFSAGIIIWERLMAYMSASSDKEIGAGLGWKFTR